MQLVVRVERAAPPGESAACAAAARAVVGVLGDDRAGPGGPWEPMIARWLRGRIRKVARRARAHAWEAAQQLDGVTARVGGAEVRAFVPGPTDAVPLALSRLQIRGLVLDDPDRREEAGSTDGQGDLVIALAPLDGYTSGKKVAAAGHAAQLALAAMGEDRARLWAGDDHPVTILHPSKRRWGDLLATVPVVVADAGFTEVDPGTVTAIAWWR